MASPEVLPITLKSDFVRKRRYRYVIAVLFYPTHVQGGMDCSGLLLWLCGHHCYMSLALMIREIGLCLLCPNRSWEILKQRKYDKAYSLLFSPSTLNLMKLQISVLFVLTSELSQTFGEIGNFLIPCSIQLNEIADASWYDQLLVLLHPVCALSSDKTFWFVSLFWILQRLPLPLKYPESFKNYLFKQHFKWK